MLALVASVRYGLGIQITSGDRSSTEQAVLASAQVRNPYPVAPAGTSQHEFGFAFDAVPIPDSKANRAKLGALAKAVGLIYGGTKDPVHFQTFTKAAWTKLRSSPELLTMFTAEMARVANPKGVTFKGVKFPEDIPGLIQSLQPRNYPILKLPPAVGVGNTFAPAPPPTTAPPVTRPVGMDSSDVANENRSAGFENRTSASDPTGHSAGASFGTGSGIADILNR